ncbi:rhodanese-like domain-containing protein [Sulfuricurvum sp.]|uniref:rhodanese-like domain-containing protein n=1 Tax=Sulfuricurvum sp. TaxID=2025608 RepID=UPI0026374D95|nr:rhodanese-like domain-containing protein [Sulfuricurvum sp.]MDD2838930.1 rhodanese-like domain-containing protein [Sulfuricurvum sp.]MDD3595020.1 rhodanese-like domain-containing protein [Sulfuricurvum sp.]
MSRNFSSLIIALVLSSAVLSGVDYDGEKSIMMEAPYNVCIIPPQVDEAAAQGITVVDAATAKKLYDHNALFFDAREKRHYVQEHIKGAYPVYFDISKAAYIVLQLPSDKKQDLVFYCYGESCANSYEAALAVRKLGYTHVYWFLNGFGEWKATGYPVN